MNILYKRIDYFEIKYLFILLTIYFIAIPFVTNVNIESLYVLTIVTLGVISFFYGYSTKKSFIIKHRNEKIVIELLLYIIGATYLSIDIVYGILNMMSKKSIEDYTSSYYVNDHNELYLQILLLLIFYFKYYIYSVFMARSSFLYYIVFLSQFMLTFNSSTRLIALSSFIIFVIYGFYMQYIKINLFKIMVAMVCSPIIFVILLLSRNKVNNLNYIDIIKNVINTLNYDMFLKILKTALESFKSYDNLINIITDNYVHIESGVIRIFFMPISRNIWEDKPESISRIISEKYNYIQYSKGGGSVATIFGDAFINGHIIGVLIIMFVLGFLSRIIYNTLLKGLQLNIKQKSIIIMFYSLFIYQFIYYYRGFFSEYIWKTLMLIFVFFVMYKIEFAIKVFYTSQIEKNA